MTELENIIMTAVILIGFLGFCLLWLRENKAMRRHRRLWSKEVCHRCGRPEFRQKGRYVLLGFLCRDCGG